MKKRIKQICASFLAAIMVFTYMPVLGLSSVYADEPENTTEAVSALEVEFTSFDLTWTGTYPSIKDHENLATVTTTDGLLTLTRGEDYEVVENTKYKDVGSYPVTFIGAGKYEQVEIKSTSVYRIVEPSGDPDEYYIRVDDESALVYDGDALDASDFENKVSVIKNDNTKVTGFTLEVTAKALGYTGNAGENYTVKAKKDGAYLNGAELDVTIAPADFGDVAYVTAAQDGTYTYNAKEQVINFTVTDVKRNAGLTLGEDYDVTAYTDNTNAGLAQATLTAKEGSNFTGSQDVDFVINPYDFEPAGLRLSLAKDEYTYTGKSFNALEVEEVKAFFKDEAGSEVIPAADLTVVVGEKSGELIVYPKDVDTYPIYLISETGNIQFPGQVERYKVQAIDPSKVQDTFKIVPAEIKAADVSYKQTADVAAGTELNNNTFDNYFEVTSGEFELKAGTDFTVAYKTSGPHNEIGKKYALALTGVNNGSNFKITGTVDVDYTATNAKFETDKYYSTSYNPTYSPTNTEGFKPTNTQLGNVTGTTEEGATTTLSSGNYTVVSWGENIHAGEGVANIEGTGVYAGNTATVYFDIEQAVVPESRTTTGWWTTTYNARIRSQEMTIPPGSYYKGQVIEGATAQVRYYNNNDEYNSGGSRGRIDLKANDITVVATGFNNTTNTLTSVSVTIKNDGDYKYSGSTFNVTGLNVANTNSIEDAVVSDTVYAGLSSYVVTPFGSTISYASETLEDYIDVTLNGTKLTDDLYRIEFMDEPFDEEKAKTEVGYAFRVKVIAESGSGLTGETDIKTITTVARPVTADDIAVTYTGEYTGKQHKPGNDYVKVTLADDDHYAAAAGTSALTTDFELTYGENVNAGNGTVTVKSVNEIYDTGDGVEEAFTIKPHTLVATDFELVKGEELDTQFFLGAPADQSDKLSIKATESDATAYVFADTDYKITPAADPVQVGTAARKAEVEVTDYISNHVTIFYKVALTDACTNYVKPADFEKSYDLTKKVYNDKEFSVVATPVPVINKATQTLPADTLTVKFGEATLTENTDYEVDAKFRAEDVLITVEFKGNYKGVEAITTNYIVTPTDLGDFRIVDPTPSECAYNEEGLTLQVNYIGTTNIPAGAAVQVTGPVTMTKNVPANGKVNFALPIGDYEAKVVAAAGYEFVGESHPINFTIVKKKLTSTDAVALFVVNGLQAGSTKDTAGNVYPVEYFGALTVAPKLFDGVRGALVNQLELVEPFVPEWNGVSRGVLKVNFTEDANYVLLDDYIAVGFDWTPGDLNWVDVNDLFKINDQTYTGKAVEPKVPEDFEPLTAADVDVNWIEVISYEDNIKVSDKSAKANVVLKVPSNVKTYTGETEGTMVFSILSPEDVVKFAEETLADAAAYESDVYSKETKDAIAKKVSDLEYAIKGADTKEILDAVEDLKAAMDAADEAKKANDEAAAAAKEAAAAYTTAAGYDEASVKAVADAVAALDKATSFDDVAKATEALYKAMADADEAKTKKATDAAIADANAAIAVADKYTDANYTFASVKAINEAKIDLQKAIKGGDAEEIRSATALLNAAVKSAVAKTDTKITVTPSKKTFKSKTKKLKKAKSFQLKADVSSGATPTFEKVGGSGRIKVSSTGKVTVKKKTKTKKAKKYYKVTVKVSVPMTETSKAATVTKTIKVYVKKKK